MVLKAKKNRRDSDKKTAALEEASKEETTRLNAEIPVSLHTDLKIRATKERCSMTEIVIAAIEEYLKEDS